MITVEGGLPDLPIVIFAHGARVGLDELTLKVNEVVAAFAVL
jgi:hypothetical protein